MRGEVLVIDVKQCRCTDRRGAYDDDDGGPPMVPALATGRTITEV